MVCLATKGTTRRQPAAGGQSFFQSGATTAVIEYDLTGISVVLANARSGTREVLRDSLHNIGFRGIVEVSRLDQVRRTVRKLDPDLLLLVADGHEDEISEIIGDVRHGRTGSNPYVVIFVLTWQPYEETVNLAIWAGADDILTMPLSVTMLSGRIENMIDNRKEFVATPDYLGPDRRNRKRPKGDALGTVRVPNNLRFKTTGDSDAASDMRALRKAQEIMAEHRHLRLVDRFDDIASELEKCAKERSGRGLPQENVAELAKLLDGLTETLESRELHNASELSASMRNLMNIIAQPVAPAAGIIALLRVHGQAAAAVLSGAAGAPDLIIGALQRATTIIGDHGEPA